MKSTRTVSLLMIIFAAFCVLSGCKNPLELSLPEQGNVTPGLLRIYIGDSAGGSHQSRTIQPGSNALAGYQLTFASETGTHDPVTISDGANYADVHLADGNWTITATAYQLNYPIGTNGYRLASGSISVSVSGGAVTGGVVPPIILNTILSNYEGTLHYAVTVESGVTGTLTLRQTSGNALVGNFGNAGVLTVEESVDGTINLGSGRYIMEARLNREDGKAAYRRDVVIIWNSTTTEFVFSPEEYLDPELMPANSNATLSETAPVIEGIALGTGTGSGADEDDPKTYTLEAAKPGNAALALEFEDDSMFAAIYWAATSGDAPGGQYSAETLPTDFSTNNVLWIKAVAEDGSTTVYYKLIIMAPRPPKNGSFTDTDYGTGQIKGTVKWTAPVNQNNISGYSVYYGSSETEKFNNNPIGTVGWVETSFTFTNSVTLPAGALFFLVYSRDEAGDYPDCLAIPIVDMKSSSGTNGYTVVASNPSGFTLSSSDVVIKQSGTYHIIGPGTETEFHIDIWSNLDVNITLKNVKINLNSGYYSAFDAGGARVNLTLEGTNTITSSNYYDALTAGTLTITGPGSLTATSTGYAGISAAITSINNAAVFASSLQPASINNVEINDSIVFIGNAGTVVGNVTLTSDMTIASGKTLTIPEGSSLTIPSGITLSNSGYISIIGGTYTGNINGNQPVTPALTISGDTAYTYASGILTITGNGTYTIGMKPGVSSTTADRIVVASGVNANITLNSVNIDMTDKGPTCFDISSGATANLTIVGDNVLKAGSNRPGLYNPGGATLLISAESTGSLTAIGNGDGAGIGGGYGGSGGTVSIAGGTITANGGGYGAGIGGGGVGDGGTVSITGGTIKATAGYMANGIGRGGYFDYGRAQPGTITEIKNAVIFASIGPALPTGDNLSNSIIFPGNVGTMYGDYTLSRDITIDAGYELTIIDGNTLAVPDNVFLNNYGKIYVGLGGILTGIVTKNQPVYSSFVVEGSTDYTYSLDRILTITKDGTYTISKREGVSNIDESIVVASGVNADITLAGVNINPGIFDSIDSNKKTSAFNMSGATVNLTLVGDNVLKGGFERAGIEAPEGSTLTISGNGSLAATGGGNGAAGIGSIAYGGNSGTISITGGTVIANGDNGGAGIGGGQNGNGGTISITGGTVTANVGYGDGAGISGGTISIMGGTVTAKNGGNDGGAGIGGGVVITEINNAVVFASSFDTPLPEGNVNNSMIFNGYDGVVYGNVTLNSNVTFTKTMFLNLVDGNELTIPNDITLTNNGTIYVDGGVITGNIAGNEVVYPSLAVLDSTAGYTYTAGILTIIGDGAYTIGMKPGVERTLSERIVVSPGVNADITLSDLKIDLHEADGLCAFDMTGATVNLTLAGDNVLRSGWGNSGIAVPAGSTLVISAASTGSLAAEERNGGAGIGGGGTITIEGGTVKLTSSNDAALGSNNGGTVNITGGTVIARNGWRGAGIGGKAINISGGNITAESYNGVGIGGSESTLSITGGTIKATTTGGEYYGNPPGIGGSGSVITELNNAVIFANIIHPALNEGDNLNDAVIFLDNTGTLYGSFTLANDVTFDAGKTLTIASGKSLTVSNGVTLTNNGTINSEGTIDNQGTINGTGIVNGNVTGNQPITP